MTVSSAGDSATGPLTRVSQKSMDMCSGRVPHVVRPIARLLHPTPAQCESSQLKLHLGRPISSASVCEDVPLNVRDSANTCDYPAH